jgi:hypothetical protein
MRMRHFYLALCVLGLLLPNALFLPWLGEHGPNARLFVRDLFANGVSGFFALDVILSAVVACGFVMVEGRRLGLRRPWLPLAAIVLVGLSVGLPLFLYQRQVHLDPAGA